MTKIDEVYDKYCYDEYGLSPSKIPIEDRKDDITDAMKEYAEWYANKCLALLDKLPLEVPIMSFQLPEHE